MYHSAVKTEKLPSKISEVLRKKREREREVGEKEDREGESESKRQTEGKRMKKRAFSKKDFLQGEKIKNQNVQLMRYVC